MKIIVFRTLILAFDKLDDLFWPPCCCLFGSPVVCPLLTAFSLSLFSQVDPLLAGIIYLFAIAIHASKQNDVTTGS